ncbi:MAG: hypothetical protein IT456_20760 [Planctomycetes bacterium]|nr:hypothetical protein [Planctomycetota bacterium]
MAAELLLLDAVLFAQELNDLALLAIDEAGKRDEQPAQEEGFTRHGGIYGANPPSAIGEASVAA